jgi:hypothetical protein
MSSFSRPRKKAFTKQLYLLENQVMMSWTDKDVSFDRFTRVCQHINHGINLQQDSRPQAEDEQIQPHWKQELNQTPELGNSMPDTMGDFSVGPLGGMPNYGLNNNDTLGLRLDGMETRHILTKVWWPWIGELVLRGGCLTYRRRFLSMWSALEPQKLCGSSSGSQEAGSSCRCQCTEWRYFLQGLAM